MQNSYATQYDWLRELPFGTVVVAKKERWIKSNLEPLNFSSDYFCNLETGKVLHLTYLADLDDPPRGYTHKSPFLD